MTVASKRHEDLYWLSRSPTSSLRYDQVRVSRLNALKFLQWGGARMVEEVGELELGDGLPKRKLQEPYYDGE
jgi:hypothetical protein